MAEIKIKGIADFSAITREVDSLTKTMDKSFGKDGKSLFDKQSMDFLDKKARQSLQRLTQEMGRLNEEAAELESKMKGSLDAEEEHGDLVKKRLENLQKIATLHDKISSIQKAQNRLVGGVPDNVIPFRRRREQGEPEPIQAPSGRTGVGGTLARGAGQIASSLPRVGGASSVVAGGIEAGVATGSLGLGLITGGIATVLGGVTLALMRMSRGFEEFKQTLPAALSMRAFGGSPLTNTTIASGLGFTAQETFTTQLGLSRAFGAASGKEEENRLGNTLAAARALGIDPNQIVGAGNNLRGAMGTQGAERTMAQILSQAIASGMDRSQAAHFLEVSASTLAEMNQNGLMTTDRMLATLTSLTAGGKMSPEQAARVMGGMNSAIANSQGDANVFFQLAAGRMGLGGGTLGGTQFAVRQGLLGIDPRAFLAQSGNSPGARQDLSDFQQMNLVGGEFSQKFAQGILKQLDDLGFDQKTMQGRFGRRSFLAQQFGLQSMGETRRVEDILNKIASGQTLTQGEETALKDLGKDAEQRWRDEALQVLRGIEGTTQKVLAEDSFRMVELGKGSAPLFNKLTDAMGSLDGAITEATQVLNKFIDTMVPDAAKREFEKDLGLSIEEGGFLSPNKLKVTDPEKLREKITPEKMQQIKDITEKHKNRGFFQDQIDLFNKLFGSDGDKSAANAPTGAQEVVASLQAILEETIRANRLREKQLKSTLPGQVNRSSTMVG